MDYKTSFFILFLVALVSISIVYAYENLDGICIQVPDFTFQNSTFHSLGKISVDFQKCSTELDDLAPINTSYGVVYVDKGVLNSGGM